MAEQPVCDIAVLGIFNADTTYHAARQPVMGESILGERFVLGPGGKGSNQAAAAAKAGGRVAMLTRLGDDAFADLAERVWTEAGVVAHAPRRPGGQTGAAFVFVETGTGDNAIIVCPGEAATVTAADVDGWADQIAGAKVFVTQLELPVEAGHRGLQIARDAGVRTILNPAPAAPLPKGMLALCDVVTPNVAEAATLTGLPLEGPADARAAAEALLERGAGAVVVTLGGDGALVHDGTTATHVPGLQAGPVVETVGAGDAFTGALAVALAEGRALLEAVRFATVGAGLSVTRAGTVVSMAQRAEIDAHMSASRAGHG